ncbi:MAG: type II toxin-antitoxin system RelE family toxin [Hyphomicrobiales bacterium]
MLKVKLSKQADRFLQKIPARHAKQIAERILALRNDPASTPTEDLKGHPPFRRLESGEYRAVYFIEEKTLFITLIGKRNDDEIYKQIARFRR